MNCAVCFQKTNLKKIIELDEILNLIQLHFTWIEPQEQDIVCRKCCKILLEFSNYCRKINEIHKKKVLIPSESDNKLIENNNELINFKTEIEDIVGFEESNEFTETVCNVNIIPIKELSPNSDCNDESSNNIEDLPITQVQEMEKFKIEPLDKVKNKRKSSYIKSRAKKEFDEESDKLIASFMKLNCHICSMKFDTFSELKRHFKCDHNISNGYTQCCKIRVYKRSQLVDHLKCCHINPEQLRCSICSKMLKSSSSLKWHIENCHSNYPRPKQKKYTCKNCNETFTNYVSYQRHLAKYLPEDQWQFECEKEGCNKMFASDTLRNNHVKNHHNKKICPECGKQISSNHFSEHLSRHSDKIDITCDICNGTFKSRRYLTVHKKRHLDENKIHKCPTCGKISPTSSALKKHISYVHNEVKLHKCNICDKTFKRRYILKQHLAVHTGQPIYNCCHCDRTFYYDSHYHAHRKSAHPIEFQNEQAIAKTKRTNFNELNVYTKN